MRLNMRLIMVAFNLDKGIDKMQLDVNKLFDMHKESMEKLSVNVSIDHNQVLNVIVNDLVKKYKSCINRNEQESEDAFKKVLTYYISEDELEELLDL